MLQFITHQNDRYGVVTGTRAVLEGGCRWVQLRMKDADDADVVRVGREIGALCRDFGARFVIDDRVTLVGTLGADGVHLGKNDMPVDEARAILGNECTIGATANTFDDIVAAVARGADYIGLGPFRFTNTKKKLSPVLGMEGYATIMSHCKLARMKLPVVAIGGICMCDLDELMKTGVSGVAVSGALLNAADPAEETAGFVRIIEQWRSKKKQSKI